MKTIMFVIVILSLFAMAPGCPGGTCPTPEKTKPVETLPPPPTEPPPVITEKSPPTEPVETPGLPGTPETKGSEKPEPKEIRLPAGGYGPAPMDAGTIARWGLLLLMTLGGIFLAGWSLKR